MYASVVLGIEHHIFEEILEYYKENKGVTFDTELSSGDWQTLVSEFKVRVEKSLANLFRKIRANSSGAPSEQCSSPG